MMKHNLLQYAVVAFVTLSTITSVSGGRELRPSDHGLAYQVESPPPDVQNDDAQQMLSFFGSSNMPLPEAQNISDTWLSVHGDGRPARDVGRDHVIKMVFLVVSAVCGLTGVVLLFVSGIVFLFRLHKQKPKAENMASTSASAPVQPGHALAADDK